MGEKKVTFRSGSETVVGVLRVPNNTESSPAVVLVHGFGSFRDELTGFVELSKKLAINKIASLRIDMRGCGESGRHGHMYPAWDWIEDIHNAISFLETVKYVDKKRIGVVGMSMGGGAVICAAATDKRPKAVVVLSPVADGKDWFRHLWVNNRGEKEWCRFQECIKIDCRNRVLTGLSKVVSASEVLAYGEKDLKTSQEMFRKYPQFLQKIALSSVDSAMKMKALDLVHALAPRPLLIIHSENDSSVPIDQARKLFAYAKGTKQLYVVKNSPHCFWIGPKSEEVQGITTEWIKKYIKNLHHSKPPIE